MGGCVMSKTSKLIVAYLLFLTVIAFFMFPSHDLIYYYYPWSLDLHLSYYEGPPMIAYILRIMTTLFGHSIFAINFFGVVISSITVYVIIKIGTILLDRKLGLIAALMWLTYPFSTTRFIFVTLNYDCLDNLFSLLSILWVMYYIRTTQIRYIYLASITLGCLLLSKYLGIVLIIGIVVYFLIYSRKVFSNVNFYIAALLCVAIFSPVLIWNIEHDFASFHYKLTFHNWSNGQYKIHRDGIPGMMFYLLSDVLGVMHVLFLVLLVLWLKHKTRLQSVNIRFLITLCTTYFFFWLYESYKSHVAMNYLISMDSIIIIITCYYLYKYGYTKAINILTGIFVLISIGMIIDRTFIKVPDSSDLNEFRAIQNNFR